MIVPIAIKIFTGRCTNSSDTNGSFDGTKHEVQQRRKYCYMDKGRTAKFMFLFTYVIEDKIRAAVAAKSYPLYEKNK